MLKLQYFVHLMQTTRWKIPDAGKDWRQEEKGTTENKMLREMKDREAWSPAVQHHQTPNNTSLYSSYQSIHCDFE